MHLGDLLRISVRPARKFIMPCSDFQGTTTAHRTPQEPQCFTDTTSLSPAKPIPGNTCPNKEEITLPGTVADVSKLACVTALTPCGVIPLDRFRNLNLIPFRSASRLSLLGVIREFRTEMSYHLGPTDPCSTAVHMEPCSTSVFKVLI